MSLNDPCLESVRTFDRFAERYARKYADLPDYDVYYQRFLDLLPQQVGSVLDVACGPGQVCAFLRRARPDLALVGIDLAPKMIEAARRRVPGATFHVGDCRTLEEVGGGFDGAVFAFGLNYLTDADAQRCFQALRRVLVQDALLLLTTLTGPEADARYETTDTGDRVYQVYRTPEAVLEMLRAEGFSVMFSEVIPSPANASVATSDLVVLGRSGG